MAPLHFVVANSEVMMEERAVALSECVLVKVEMAVV